MSQSIFKRVEIKYLLSEAQYQEMMKRLEPYMRIDEYGLSEINSIYYDTEGYDIVRESLEKPVYKEKLRLRVYGEVNDDSKAFLELKKKYKGVVYKRRIAMKLREAEDYLNKGVIPDINSQIFREIDYFVKFYRPTRKNLVKYQRIALFGIDDKDIRITFDSDILVKLNEGNLRKPENARNLLNPGERLMEIKVPGAMPMWLASILSELNIRPSSFSKIGEGCKRYMAADTECVNMVIQKNNETAYAAMSLKGNERKTVIC